MPIIVLTSPKGGVGKTTTALILANEIAKSALVSVIDADPNRPIKAWAEGPNLPKNLTVIGNADEDNILDVIEEAAQKTAFVIVDLEGTASRLMLLALSQADLIIIPMQGSQLDADQAGRALRVVKQQEKMSRRKIPYGVVLTRTSPAVRSKNLKHIANSLRNNGVEVFDVEIQDREAFRAMFSFSQPLEHLDPKEVANISRAISNAQAITSAVIAKLRSSSGAAV